MIIYLNFIVIENYTSRNLEGPVLVEGPIQYQYWAFHISGSTIFKLSNISFAYLHCFSHFIRFCFYLDKEMERKITTGLYIREGSNNRPFQILDLGPRLIK
jgi:hypothetical protein